MIEFNCFLEKFMNHWVMDGQTNSGHFAYAPGNSNQAAIEEVDIPDNRATAHFEVEDDSDYERDD